MSTLGAEVDGGVMRHPAGRRRSIGFQRVELRPAETIRVQVFIGMLAVDRPVTIPAVYALECHGCGCLFRIGSPHLLAHHQAHRRRSLPARARVALSLAGHYARWTIERGLIHAGIR